MRDHDEVFRRVMKAKEQYEQQKKEKSMYRVLKNAPGGGASGDGRNPSKAFVWAMRVVAALVCVAIIGGIVFAVQFKAKEKDKNSKSAQGNVTPTGQVTNDPTEGPTGTPSGESTVLTMWCLASEESYDRVAYEQAIAEMQERYPTVEFQWRSFNGPDEYYTALKSALQTGEAPDIFCTGQKYVLDDLVSLGQTYCLDSVQANYSDGLSGAMRETVSYDGHMYGIPYSVNAIVLYVNMDVLRSAGINTVPSTYDELIACCETLRQRGVVPFGCATEGWCLSEFLEQLIIKEAGASTLEAIWRNDASWQNRSVIEAVDLFEEYVRNGYFGSADAESVRENSDVMAGLINGQYAFYVNGSWNSENFAHCGSDIVAVEFPVINSANAGNYQLLINWGGALSVYNNSEQKEFAAQYAMQLGQLLSKHMYLGGWGLPTWQINYVTNGENPLFQQIAGMVQQAGAFAFTSDCVMDTITNYEYSQLVQRVYNREINGAAFTAAMDALNAR